MDVCEQKSQSEVFVFSYRTCQIPCLTARTLRHLHPHLRWSCSLHSHVLQCSYTLSFFQSPPEWSSSSTTFQPSDLNICLPVLDLAHRCWLWIPASALTTISAMICKIICFGLLITTQNCRGSALG